MDIFSIDSITLLSVPANQCDYRKNKDDDNGNDNNWVK